MRKIEGKVAKRSDDITDEMWEEVNKFNRDMVKDYLENQTHLSPKSLLNYSSALRIYFWWVKENLNNKNCTEIKKKEFLRFLNWMNNRGLSDSAMKFKKSSVSAFNTFIENFYEDEFPLFRNYVSSDMKVATTGKVHEKIPLTPEEIDFLYKELEARNEWQKLAYVKFSYSTGCRRAEARQLLKEIINYEPRKTIVKVRDENGVEHELESISYKTHNIRCKGKSKIGRIRKLQFGQDVKDAIEKWLEVRGDDDCPYVFVVKHKDGSVKQVGEETFNGWCKGLFSEIMKRRINPHCFRMSRATNLVCSQGRSIETAQKLLGHESSETTKIYVVREDSFDADDAFTDL